MCLVRTTIAFVADATHMLALNIKRDLHIHMDKAVSSYPNVVRIYLEVEANSRVMDSCEIEMGIIKGNTDLQTGHPVEKLKVGLKMPALLFKQGDTTHFIVDMPDRVLSWQYVNAYCSNEFNARALYYNSIEDLSQIFSHLSKRPAIVYTSFMIRKQVSLY